MNLTTCNIDLLFNTAILAITALIFSFCYNIDLMLTDIRRKIDKLSPMTNNLKEYKQTMYYESDKDSVSIVSDSDYEPDDEYSDEESFADEEIIVPLMKKKIMNSCIDYIKARNKDGVIDYVKNFGSTVIIRGTTKADRHWVYRDLNGIIDAKWNEIGDYWSLNLLEVLLDNKEKQNVVYTYDVDEEKSEMESSLLYTGRISKPPTYYVSSFIPPPVKKTKTDSDNPLIDNIWKNEEVEAIKFSGKSVIEQLSKAYEKNSV